MRKGTIGTIIIGIIFIITGVGYLDDIVASVNPVNWESLREKHLSDFDELAAKKIKLHEREMKNAGGDVWELGQVREDDVLLNINEAREKIILSIQELKNLETEYFLMTNPAKLFLNLIASAWLIVVGMGFIIVFPWARWFVYLSIFISYFWQTYNYLFQRSINEILESNQVNIQFLMDMPAATSSMVILDPGTQNQVLFTFIFLGILYYFGSPVGQSLFKEPRKNTVLEELLKENSDKRATLS